MKKFLSFGIVTTMIIGILSGCGSSAQETHTQGAGVSADTTETLENFENKKVLVAYYSASGNTKTVAEYIANETGADTFEMVPQEIYTDDDLNWMNKQSRSSFEMKNSIKM